MANRYRMLHQGVIAVRDEDMSQEAGRVVYWSIHGDLPIPSLRAALAGILAEDDLPVARGPQQVFTNTVKKLEEKRTLVRPLTGKAGFAIVQETEARGEGDPLTHETLCQVRLETGPDGEPRIASVPEGHPLRTQLAQEFERQMEILPAAKVGIWLVGIAERVLAGVSLRPSGGFYFIPRSSVGTWQAISLATKELGIETFQIPAVTSTDAVRAVSSAISREAQNVLDAVAADLDAGVLGSRALVNRESELRGIEAKLRMYEDILGMSLDGLRGKVDEVQANLAAAALTRLTTEEETQAA